MTTGGDPHGVRRADNGRTETPTNEEQFPETLPTPTGEHRTPAEEKEAGTGEISKKRVEDTANGGDHVAI